MEIPRDWQGRPLVRPVDGGKPVAYTRASTLAKALDDTYNLTQWKIRKAMVGLATNRHLIQQVVGIANRYDDPAKEGKKVLDALAEEAHTAAGGDNAAATGTALHDFTELMDAGREIVGEPAEFKPLLQAYRTATAGLERVGSEIFVVVDELGVAGSLDALWACPDGHVRVGDLKSGEHEPKYPLGVTVQVAVYAHGQRYDPATGERSPLHPDLDTESGLLVHLPFKAEWPRCDLYELDLEVGWAAAVLATQVRATRKAKPIRPYVIPEPDLFSEAAS